MDAERHSIRLPAQIRSVAPATEFLRAGAALAGVPDWRIQQLDLVVEELVVNIARYAYGEDGSGDLELTYSRPAPALLEVEVSDEGVPFDPVVTDTAPDLNGGLLDRKIGGLGIFLVKSLVSSLAYRRQGNRNILAFRFGAAER